MYTLAIFSAFLVVAYGLPTQQLRILNQAQVIHPDGSYEYGHETENGIQAQESGVQKPVPEGIATVAQGFYRYTAPSGEPIEVRYIADENGFRADGNAIPQSPPIPPLILKALQWMAANPKPEQRLTEQIRQNVYYQ